MRNSPPSDGQVVPLLAGHLARLAADADRRVGEEAHALGAGPDDRELGHSCSLTSAGWSRLGATPGGVSWMPASWVVPARVAAGADVARRTPWTRGSTCSGRPRAGSGRWPRRRAPGRRVPQCQGRPIWWIVARSIFSGRMRLVTRARATISAARRGDRHPAAVLDPLARRRAPGRSRRTSPAAAPTSHGSQRDIPPAVWCSVSRKVVATCG